MKIKKLFLLSFALFAFVPNGNGQSLLKDSIMPAFLLELNYSFQFPFADMAKRFGGNNALGGTIGYKTKKNWTVGLEGMAIIGEKVKEPNAFLGAASSDGTLIGSDGSLENWQLHERGFAVKFVLGKIIHFKKPNVNSGLLIQIGGGFIQHRVKVETDAASIQINGAYSVGYDHLTNGGLISEFIGYQYMGVKRRINFYGGIEVSEGIVKGRRTWDYTLNKPDDYRQFDMLIGLKVGWILPKYFLQTEKYYTY